MTATALSTSPLLGALFDEPGVGRCLVAPDGSILRANPEWLRATGFALDEVIGADVVALFPETRDLTLALHARARAGHRVEVPRHAQRVNGRETWWEGAVEPIPMEGGMGLLITAREVTPADPRGGARRARSVEPVCGSLLDLVNDAIFLHDVATGAIVDVNRRAEEMYEATREEICATPVERISAGVPPFTQREAIAHLEAAAAGPPQLFEWHARTANGRLFWVEVNIKRITVGTCERLVAVVRDVSERKRAEEALRAALAQLRDADRRKDEFLGVLSHELRNPLAPIRNALDILERSEPGGQRARRAREVASRQVTHLTRLVDDLLDVTRIARGKIALRRVELDLVALARRAADDHRAVMRDRGLTLALDAPDRPVIVNGDDTRLAQVVGNLLGNAAKFTPSGGRVTLSIRARGPRAVLRVRDTGAGVDPALLERIFDPFTQAHQTLARSEGGLGLGLALVKGLVALHGGEVTAASDGAGRGAEFVVGLPLAGPAPRPDRTEQDPPRSAPASRRRVLVVDDNRDAAETLAMLVEMLGHDAELAYDGAAALARARERLPDVVLCDIGLPGMNGYEVARRLRAEGGPRLTLVAVSGYAQPEDVARALESGFDGHVAKPADPDALARLLR